MSHNLTMTDLFCGAGGSSTGAVAVPGVTVRLAANHWDLAIETHNANHPDTDHLLADISQTDPRYVPRTDMLWASPECTNHSQAKGRKKIFQADLFGDNLPDEAAERSRATMWDVVRFTEVHQYRAVIVENVVDVLKWAPDGAAPGVLFDAWLNTMRAMGYDHRLISLNSMHAQTMGLPAPQSRDRLYIAFWRVGERAPDFERMQRPRAWCPSCGEVVESLQTWKRAGARAGKYRSQYHYRCPKHSCRGQIVEPAWLPASSIIDWTVPGQRIGDRDKPLADKTMRRIQMGIDRYWSPVTVEMANGYDAADPKHPAYGRPGSYYRAWPTYDVLRTIPAEVESKALAYAPVMVPVEGRDGKEPASMLYPTRTMTTRNETGIAYPPFLTELRGGGSTVRLASDALSTVSAGGNHHGLVMPYYGNGQVQPTDRALPTVTTLDRHALITRMNTNRGDQSSLTTPDFEPIRTLTAAGNQALLTGQTVDIDDVHFRMLEPAEIKQAMAFPADYLMLGNRREQVKLSGNAVTPPAARDLIAAVSAAITGESA